MTRTSRTRAPREGAAHGIDPSPGICPRLVPGTLVVALLVTGGRWGSYLGWPDRQIFITDVMLVVSTLWTVGRYHSLPVAGLPAQTRVLLPVLALTAWALVRAIPGVGDPDLLRDLAPYVYLSVAVLALVPTSHAARRRTMMVMGTALVVHAAWMTFSLVQPSAVASLPLLGGTVRVLEVRGDFDGAQLAVLAGLAAYALGSVRSRWVALVLVAVIAWTCAVVLLLANRAALLALVLALATALVVRAGPLLDVFRRRKALTAGVLALGLAIAVVLVPTSPTYQRLTGNAKFANNSTAGTTHARELAWAAVIAYVNTSATWVVLGVGMGPDYLKASGASVNYQYVGAGVKPVRQPHNYLVNTYARLGLVGVALLAWLLVALAIATVRVARRAARRRADLQDALGMLSILLGLTLLLTAMIGVILESPFGAVPFGWAAGIVLTSAARQALREGA